MTLFRNHETPAARRKRNRAEEARRNAERERIFDNGVWWAGFLGWHLASGIWIALLLIVLFIEFWIGVARGFYDEWKRLKKAWREREKEDLELWKEIENADDLIVETNGAPPLTNAEINRNIN